MSEVRLDPPVAPGSWAALRYYGLYRLVISGLFIVLILTGNLPPPLAVHDRVWFEVVGVVYFVAAVAVQIVTEQRRAGYRLQIVSQVLIDIIALTLLMYASGGVASGFGTLIIVAIGGGSLLVGRRAAVAFAALASLAVLGEELYWWAWFYFPVTNYTQAGILGAALFVVALFASIMGQRVRETEALASQHAADLADLAALNEHVIQRMQSGILATDGTGRIRMLNHSAAQFLGCEADAVGRPLADASPELHARERAWRAGERPPARTERLSVRGGDVLASFTELGPARNQGTLVFLEDAAVTRQRAQQLKLASLGRLTASIAHEIRNPLGAVSHAAQLLSESTQRRSEDQRLTRIIREQSERMNAIIETILALGRRAPTQTEQFALHDWLAGFAGEFCSSHGLASGEVLVDAAPAPVLVRMDPGQLRQVLWNLCSNALRYSRATPVVRLRIGINAATARPCLDVVDTGPGIDPAIREHVFEPFFTTARQGTGLGLYIASELCEANQASLILYETGESGSIFRINFAHPDRKQSGE
jgi:two-component system sensor histidine kinase PilS (NtrC family)